MTAARARPAGVLHRPADDPAGRRPANHRFLPRHPAAAPRLRPRPDRQAARPARPGRTWTPLPSARSSLTWRPAGRNSAATRNNRLAAIHSCSATPPWKAPDQDGHHQPRAGHPGQAPPPPPSSATSPQPSSTRSSPRPDQATWHGRRDHALLRPGSPDRAAGLRDHQPRHPRRPPRHRSASSTAAARAARTAAPR